jgi:hypothetical protein
MHFLHMFTSVVGLMAIPFKPLNYNKLLKLRPDFEEGLVNWFFFFMLHAIHATPFERGR